jgi:signal transduction histidine kinase
MSVAARARSRITQLAVGRHLPYRTVRVRLTLLYGALFLISGAALMAIAYALLANAGFVFTLQNGPANGPAVASPSLAARTQSVGISRAPAGFAGPGSRTHPSAQTMAHWRTVARCMRQQGVSTFPDPTTSVPRDLAAVGEVSDRDGAILVIPAVIDQESRAFVRAGTKCGFISDQLSPQDNRRRTQVRQELLIQSGIALAGMSLLSLALGWLMAGRVLQPLEDSYQAQRRFVANASHELRGPLTLQRALIEVALDNPEASLESLRTAHERALASQQELEELIDALLALTRGQAGIERREQVDLATLTSQALSVRESQIAGLDLDVATTLATARTAGDPRLLKRLIANLLENAIRHNIDGGHIEITTGTRDRRAFVSIANTGPTVPPDQIDRLFEPFQRLGGARTRNDGGHGLGLSIVEAIANAHRAELGARPRPEGGLTVEVSLPPVGGPKSRRLKKLYQETARALFMSVRRAPSRHGGDVGGTANRGTEGP